MKQRTNVMGQNERKKVQLACLYRVRDFSRPSLRSLLALFSLLREFCFTATPTVQRKQTVSKSLANQILARRLLHARRAVMNNRVRGVVFNVLPVGKVSVCLNSLGTEVGHVAGEEEVVLGRNSE